MFTPARMREVNLFIRDGDIVALSAALVRLGMLQVEEEPGRADAGSFSRWTGLAKAYTAQARRAEELLAGLGIAWQKSTAPEQLDLEQDLAQIVTALDQIEQAVDDWRQRRSTTAQEADRVHLVIEQLQLLAPLDVPVERLAQFERLHLTIGVMPTANLLRLQTSLFRIPFVMIPVMIPAMVPASVNGARTLVFAATTQENQPILDRALRSAFFEPVPLPDSVQGVPAQAIATLEQQAVELREHQQTLETERRQLAGMWSAPLLDLWKRAQTGSVLAETICRFPHQGEIYLIAGWVPAAALPQVVDEVQAVTEGRAIIEILEPDADRAQVPTLLQNPAWLRSFEQLVTNFGCPGYDEIDPTPLLAVSFLVMYGVMFGDIGHGLLLSLAGLWLMRRKGGQSGVAQLAPILVMAGLSAAFFGVLYGSVFGQPLLPAVWLKPMDNIMALLAFAVAGGVVLLNIGFVTNMIMAARRRRWFQLFLTGNGLAGFWLYWALLAGVVAILRGVPLPGTAWAVLAAVPALLLFLREPLARLAARRRPLVENGWGEYLVLAFFELFETLLSYVSNSLSFIRLGAFAVAHEGLSQAIFLLAGMSGGPGWLIVLVGTIFIVGFEGLIVGIQTLRLEYYEFFGKFFHGTGHRFAPLRIPGGEHA